MLPFQDRRDAGAQLATRLRSYALRHDVVVLGLPRGGVPVAAEVARALRAPLDVLVVRKLGVPGHEELAMGALASGGTRVLNDAIVRDLRIPAAAIDRVTEAERDELERRERAFRGDRPPPALAGATVLVVDDGIATGATMRSAVRALRSGMAAADRPARVVAAAPVAAADAVAALRGEADEVVVLATPADFLAVGRWYRIFPQTSDEEVRALLQEGRSAAEAENTGAP